MSTRTWHEAPEGRAALEDRLLREELSGYRAYAGNTRTRLIPFLW